MTLAAVALATVALLAAGCGQQQSQRDAVATYLKQVDKVESALARPLATVTTIGNQFAQEQSSGGTLTTLVTTSHRQALLGAWSQITMLRSHLAAIRTPFAASRLRGMLLAIVDGQARLTRELAELVEFLPRFGATLRPLVHATRRLELALAQQTVAGAAAISAVYASKAAALRQFKRSVDGVVTQLLRLQPPAVSRPQYETELASLKGMSSSAGRLAGALTSGAQANVQKLLLGFDRAATLSQTIPAQKAQIAAVRAYDNQSTLIQQLSQAAERERLRLANTLA